MTAQTILWRRLDTPGHKAAPGPRRVGRAARLTGQPSDLGRGGRAGS